LVIHLGGRALYFSFPSVFSFPFRLETEVPPSFGPLDPHFFFFFVGFIDSAPLPFFPFGPRTFHSLLFRSAPEKPTLPFFFMFQFSCLFHPKRAFFEFFASYASLCSFSVIRNHICQPVHVWLSSLRTPVGLDPPRGLPPLQLPFFPFQRETQFFQPPPSPSLPTFFGAAPYFHGFGFSFFFLQASTPHNFPPILNALTDSGPPPFPFVRDRRPWKGFLGGPLVFPFYWVVHPPPATALLVPKWNF